MTRFILLSTTLLSLLACVSGSGKVQDSADSGATTDSGPPPTDSNTDSPTVPGPTWTELSDPCGGAGTPYAMYFQDTGTGYVGCGNGIGLWATSDGGDTFVSGHPSTPTGDLYVNVITPDPDGGILVCGHDYAVDPGAFLYRYADGAWETLLTYGSNNSSASSVQMANCGVVAAAGDGTMLMASDTAGDISWSEDHGQTWSAEERYWEDANLDPGGYAYYYMLNLVAADGGYFGAGSRIVEPPVFYSASRHSRGAWHNFSATVIDSATMGEVWALATPDGGATWLAGGRDQARSSEPSGFMYRSEDGGATWRSLPMGGTLDIVHDIEFAADGLHGVAVGHRYPPSSLGGFVLLTDDGGLSWTELLVDVPPLYTAAIVDTTFWAAGDAFLARGAW